MKIQVIADGEFAGAIQVEPTVGEMLTTDTGKRVRVKRIDRNAGLVTVWADTPDVGEELVASLQAVTASTDFDGAAGEEPRNHVDSAQIPHTPTNDRERAFVDAMKMFAGQRRTVTRG